jgi:starvation-inducible outer membrane lipoprotein
VVTVRPGLLGIGTYRLLHAGVAVVALVLAACTSSPPPVGQQASVSLAPAKQADPDMPAAVLREHQRITAT